MYEAKVKRLRQVYKLLMKMGIFMMIFFLQAALWKYSSIE
ncbi:hypothetical protein B4123_2324 [Bacillus paralicheniformis]|uniref:Uncharacterized protein n=1 Tax=Bacillus paralicheniformis TaxID=1648923 RepID=A0ABY3FSZ0_9BACI|nr:hypothetical protein SC10_B2orf05281 [Bacillus paralicheniformis]KUL15572.1 hypothetical protein LI6934_19775 [Bacillus licheniformis LMG 6934]KFM84797.1 putative membrane protein [Bacillus paralicheniformis]OLG01151.1 hypothetical protein B4123_4496 [Bacillus paralicheniformis]OLG04502.1 hypothetical protein B4125_2574 [Bacillus paralicheniformis]